MSKLFELTDVWIIKIIVHQNYILRVIKMLQCGKDGIISDHNGLIDNSPVINFFTTQTNLEVDKTKFFSFDAK